ncbi:MAG: L-threonylcarbamoyladenylate synthase [Terrimicrobiaceae bacterium]
MKTRRVEGDSGVHAAARLLKMGELVAVPTETVYGLAAKALDPIACAKIFEAKARPLSDPLIIHIPEMSWLKRLSQPSRLATELAQAFWPGPLTLVVAKKGCVPDLVTAGQESVAIRMSAHPLFAGVLNALGEPVAAPSANRFGRISPTTAGHVMEELEGKIPMILDGGPCQHGIESTIVLIAGNTLQILRHGPITVDQLSAYAKIHEGESQVLAPGRLKSHYAPQTPLEIQTVSALRGWPHTSRKTGLLAWQHSISGFNATEVLTPSGNPIVAATNLYAAMRRLDAAGLDLILAEEPPLAGLGTAIFDRLKKAAA